MKNNKLKKFIFTPFVFIYDIVSLFLCYLILQVLIYDSFPVVSDANTITIIGGADTPTLIAVLNAALGVLFLISFMILCLGSAVLSTIAIFKKEIKLKFNILLLIFSSLSLVNLLLIPPQTFTVPIYMLIRFEQLPQIIAYSDIIYMIFSAVIVILNVLLLIKNKKLKTQKCEAIGE